MSVIEKEKLCARAVFKYKPNLIARLKMLFTFKPPDNKTLASLWHHYGYPRTKLSKIKVKTSSEPSKDKSGHTIGSESHDELSCLYDWLDILYGKEIAEWANPHRLIDNYKHTASPFIGSGSRTHVNRRKPFDTMLLKLSESLPLYDDTDDINLLKSDVSSGAYNINNLIKGNDIFVGGLYATQNADGTFGALKVLAVDNTAVHIRTYANVFQSPRDIYQHEDLLTLGSITLDGNPQNEKYGIGHLPISIEGFWKDNPIYVKTTDLQEEELEGYRLFLEQIGGD